MVLDLKLRKVGNSVGVILPKEALSRMNVSEGDTLVLTESQDGGFRVTPHTAGFDEKMKVFQSISRRYRNTLRELSK